jgi:hypothetical protein
MTHGMRRGLMNYGDSQVSLLVCKAFIKATGFSGDALTR